MAAGPAENGKGIEDVIQKPVEMEDSKIHEEPVGRINFALQNEIEDEVEQNCTRL